MKRIYNNTIQMLLAMITLVGFVSCEDEDLPNNGDPVIHYIRTVDPASSDSLLVAAYEGTLLAIIGDNLGKTNEIWFNDQQASLSPVYVTNTSILVSIPTEEPEEVTNRITLNFSGGSSLVYDFEVFIIPEETGLSPVPVEIGGVLTITGTYLDNVSALIFPGEEGQISVSDFESQSATQIEVIVPEGAQNGFMRFVTIHGNTAIMSIELVLPTLNPLAYTIYSDELQNGWQIWGWGGEIDVASTEQVLHGEYALRKAYDGSWDAVYFGNGSVTTDDYENLVIYAYAPGDASVDAQVVVNSGTPIPYTVLPGEWVEIIIPVADFGTTTWTDVFFQGQGASGAVYYDFIGFR